MFSNPNHQVAFSSPLPLSSSNSKSKLKKCNKRPPRAIMERKKTNSQSSSNSSYNPGNEVRPELKTMAPYTPILPYEVLAKKLGRHPSDIVKLDANENPYGPAPGVLKALAEAPYLHIYPDPESTYLRQALSEYTNLPSQHLLVGAGADEIIDLLFRLFITPGKNQSIINCPPTFGMYKFDADVNGADIISIERDPNSFKLDIQAIENIFEQNHTNPPKMIFIASPNNPDGSIISDDDLLRLLSLSTLVVLDEAYFEFADKNRLLWVPNHNNLVVLRTFSKWAALAGMRVGYAAFPLDIIKHLWKIKQPYNVSVASQIAATVSLEEKHDLLAKVDKMIKQRENFYNQVEQFSWLHPFPSQSNYVLCRVSCGRSASDIKQKLADNGILIRYYTSKGLQDCIRVSMGTDEQMERLYQELAKL